MLPSRAEFGLQLRIDNVGRRLTPYGHRIGLIGDQAWSDFQVKQQRLEKMKELLEKTKVTSQMLSKIISPEERTGQRSDPSTNCHPERRKGQPSAVEGPCVSNGRSTPADLSSALGQTLSQLLKRPEVSIEKLVPVLRDLAPDFFASSVPSVSSVVNLSSSHRNDLKSVETEIKYAGYLTQQQRSIDRMKKAEQRSIPDWFDYGAVSGLSREMQEKLLKIRPRTLGHAARIPGVTPAAVSLVNVYIELQARRREQAAAL